MNILPYIIFSASIILIVNTIIWILHKNGEKKDKGFVLIYYKLSYRRRLIRTLWSIPFIIILYLAIYQLDVLTLNEKIAIGVIYLLLAIIDIVYNYIKWKKVERTYNMTN